MDRETSELIRSGEPLTDEQRALAVSRHALWLETPEGRDAAEWAVRNAEARRTRQAS